jgi:hypothetical protein
MGPYCQLCNVSDRSRYYDSEQSECVVCKVDAVAPLLRACGLILLVVVVVLLFWRFKPYRRVPLLARLARWFMRLFVQLSLRSKAKQLLGFYQIATRIGDVYKVPMPEAVVQLLSFFEVLNLNIGGIGLPLQCLGIGTYVQQLAVTMFLPLVIAVAILFGFVLRSCYRSKGIREGLMAALPWLLSLTFLVFPMVSSAAFRAFSCESFDGGHSFLRADYSLECDTTEHTVAKNLAVLGILTYPFGISLLYILLMLCARRALLDERPTKLSQALSFLVRDYEPAYFWWELVEAWKKLVLVGFAVLVSPGSVVQLASAFLFALVYMLLTSTASPFKNHGDDYFAQACSFGITAVFFFCIILKLGVLTEAVDASLSLQMRALFMFDETVVTVGLVISLAAALVMVGAMAAHDLIKAAQLPIIKLKVTKAMPDLALAKGHKWHMFLSHIWGTGQDQCANIKRQLCLLLPGVSVFLDVDDLEDIGALETYVEQSANIMIFVSKGYFKSKNCIREAQCTVAKAKPITLVHDPVRGGGSVEFIKNEECNAELRGIFEGRDIIVWHRIKAFQDMSLQLLAEQLLLSCPSYASAKSLPLYVPGEITLQRIQFSSPVVLYASKNNPGAAAAAAMLVEGVDALSVTEVPPALGGVAATHFLLYLAHETYVGEAGDALAEELREARANHLPLVMLHENNMDNGGCEFARFFETTPQDLIAGGLYTALAFANYPGPFRPISIALTQKYIADGLAGLAQMRALGRLKRQGTAIMRRKKTNKMDNLSGVSVEKL